MNTSGSPIGKRSKHHLNVSSRSFRSWIAVLVSGTVGSSNSGGFKLVATITCVSSSCIMCLFQKCQQNNLLDCYHGRICKAVNPFYDDVTVDRSHPVFCMCQGMSGKDEQAGVRIEFRHFAMRPGHDAI